MTVFHVYDNSLRVNFIYLFTYLFLAVLGLRCSVDFALVVASRGCSLTVVLRPLTVVASPLRSTACRIRGLSSRSAWVSFPEACGIFLDQGLKPCPLYRQAVS